MNFHRVMFIFALEQVRLTLTVCERPGRVTPFQFPLDGTAESGTCLTRIRRAATVIGGSSA